MKFRKFAATSQGLKYFEKDWNCQDSSSTFEFQNVQVIAVADGHGSSDCFRSEFGSKLATDILSEQVKIFCQNLTIVERFSDTGIKKFKFDFVNEWRKAVKNDWDERLKGGALGENEVRYKSVSDKYKARYTSDNPQIVEEYLYNAYGTTLICAISIGTQILILQIGDGTCVVLQQNGEFKIPVPPSDENFLNVTTSLCESNAELKIRHAILNCENPQNAPVAIFLSTDGVDNCFPYYKNEEHLYNFYSGVIIENMLSAGYDATEKEIAEQLLAGMSKKGSKDDISLAYFVAEDIKVLEETYKNIDAKYKSAEKKVESPAENQSKNISANTKVETLAQDKLTASSSDNPLKNISANTKVETFAQNKLIAPSSDNQLKNISANTKIETLAQDKLTAPSSDNQLKNISADTKIETLAQDKLTASPSDNRIENIASEVKIAEQNLSPQNFSGAKILKVGEYSISSPVQIPGVPKSD